MKVTRCQAFAKEDLILWLSEPVVYGDSVFYEEKKSKEKTTKPSVSLFTSAGSEFASTSGVKPSSPAVPPPGPTGMPKNSSISQLKFPSKVPTNSRHVPYAQRNRTTTVTNSISTTSAAATNKDEPVVDDKFLSQLFDGIDADKLFNDF